ncbi:MAG: hypothetical protein R2695_01685 [Acidimicrobiales bacterium]
MAAAAAATERPTASAVANGRLLALRLHTINGSSIAPFVGVEEEVAEAIPRDPDEDAHARRVLVMALGSAVAVPEARWPVARWKRGGARRS